MPLPQFNLGFGPIHSARILDEIQTNVLGQQPATGQYWTGITMRTIGTAGVATGAMQASLIWVPRKMTFDRIALEITTAEAAGKLVRLSVYSMDYSTYKPSALILDAGAVAGDATGIIAATISLQLSKGLYWGVLDPEDTIAYRSYTTALMLMGHDGTTWVNVRDNYYATHVYGAAPSTFPTADSAYYWSRAGGVQLRILSLD